MMTPDNEEQLIESLAEHYRAIIGLLGEDVDREGLRKTPERAAKALYYCTRGYRQNLESVINDALFQAPERKGLVIVKDIEFYSLCEHHVLPFFGHVSIGYMPGERIVGISKLARVVDMFARRLQVQEHLTQQIADELCRVLGAEGVIVNCRAEHLCMKMRGVQKQDSLTVTTAACGVLEHDKELRAQFFAEI